MAAALADLIAGCDARLVALHAEAAQAAEDGALTAARSVHVRSLEVRRELEDLQMMHRRLQRRFSTPATHRRPERLPDGDATRPFVATKHPAV